MNSLRSSLQKSTKKWALRLTDKKSTRSLGEKMLLQLCPQTLYIQCQYFVLPEDPVQPGRTYLGFAAVPNAKPQNVAFNSDFFRFEALHIATPNKTGLEENDGVSISFVTVRRTKGNRLRIWTAPNRVGKGMNLRTVQYSGPDLYLYELQPNGKSIGNPQKLNDRPLYITLDTSYLLTDTERSFTLKFICSGHCCWQLPVT